MAYLRDLGLIAPTQPVTIANPIYREVILRVLGAGTFEQITTDPAGFVGSDGRLDFRKLLTEFATFWRQHGNILVQGTNYHEVAPQLVLMAYLQRVVNGGGHIDREVGVGRGRIDLVVRWPYQDRDGQRRIQYEPVELKVWAKGQADPTGDGLTQLDGHLDQLDVDHGTLVVFDRRPEAPPIGDRTGFRSVQSPRGRPVTLLRG